MSLLEIKDYFVLIFLEFSKLKRWVLVTFLEIRLKVIIGLFPFFYFPVSLKFRVSLKLGIILFSFFEFEFDITEFDF